jgi:MoxR-like ATPase
VNNNIINTIDDVQAALAKNKYICDRALATGVFLGQSLEKPLLLEGEAGVGKTEVAKVVAKVLNARLIRLQCYEGLDAEHALYEWNYQKQILEIQFAQANKDSGCDLGAVKNIIFSEDYLLKRPLLEAILSPPDVPVVLLIDEVDRADEGFEAFLLEVLSDFQITIPEIGTIKATQRPTVFLTSNQTRELHDALKRRCLYHWIDYPTYEKEVEIVLTRMPDVEKKLAQQICSTMNSIRQIDFIKKPGIAETLDWTEALVKLHQTSMDFNVVQETLGCIFKHREDMALFKEKFNESFITELVTAD